MLASKNHGVTCRICVYLSRGCTYLPTYDSTFSCTGSKLVVCMMFYFLLELSDGVYSYSCLMKHCTNGTIHHLTRKPRFSILCKQYFMGRDLVKIFDAVVRNPNRNHVNSKMKSMNNTYFRNVFEFMDLFLRF